METEAKSSIFHTYFTLSKKMRLEPALPTLYSGFSLKRETKLFVTPFIIFERTSRLSNVTLIKRSFQIWLNYAKQP